MELLCSQAGLTFVNSTLIETVPEIPYNSSYELFSDVDNGTFQQILNHSELNTDLSNLTRQGKKLLEWDYGTFTRRIAIPLLCIIGIIGNILNAIILTKKIKEGKTSNVRLDNCHFQINRYRLIVSSNKMHCIRSSYQILPYIFGVYSLLLTVC